MVSCWDNKPTNRPNFVYCRTFMENLSFPKPIQAHPYYDSESSKSRNSRDTFDDSFTSDETQHFLRSGPDEDWGEDEGSVKLQKSSKKVHMDDEILY